MTTDISRRNFLKGVVALTALPAEQLSAFAIGSQADNADPVERCLEHIRSLQLPNGAINIRTERNVPTDKPVSEIVKKRIADDTWQAKENHEDPANRKIDTIRVDPYFSHFAALALLSAQAHGHKDIKNMQAAACWVNFCIRAQDKKTGLVFDHGGSLSKNTFKSKDRTDAVDSSASVFLLLAERYQQEMVALPPREKLEVEKSIKTANKALDPIYPSQEKPIGDTEGSLLKEHMKELVAAAKLCLHAIETVQKDDGLTVAANTYPVKFLMDNVEVYGGLIAGVRFFERAGEKEEAKKASDMAQKVAEGLKSFWKEDQGLFAWNKQGASHYDTALKVSYPDELAQLFATSWIKADPEVWSHLKKEFSADDASTPEHWLMAAIAAKDTDQNKYRQRVIDDMATFDNTTLCYRLGLGVLSLLEGRSWMPSIAEPEKALGSNRGKE